MSAFSETQRLIQSKETKLWLKPDGQWTGEMSQARMFKGIIEALGAVEQAFLKNTQFVIHFGSALQPDIVINLPNSRLVLIETKSKDQQGC